MDQHMRGGESRGASRSAEQGSESSKSTSSRSCPHFSNLPGQGLCKPHSHYSAAPNSITEAPARARHLARSFRRRRFKSFSRRVLRRRLPPSIASEQPTFFSRLFCRWRAALLSLYAVTEPAFLSRMREFRRRVRGDAAVASLPRLFFPTPPPFRRVARSAKSFSSPATSTALWELTHQDPQPEADSPAIAGGDLSSLSSRRLFRALIASSSLL